MTETQTQPIEHCPRYPEHCSMACMERMRAEFGFYALSEPPFEDWCLFAGAARRQDEARCAEERERLIALHQQEFPDDAPE